MGASIEELAEDLRDEGLGTAPRQPLLGFDVTFLPGDPPRTGWFAFYQADQAVSGPGVAGPGVAGAPSLTAELEVALLVGQNVRRRKVPAVGVPVGEAIGLFSDPDSGAGYAQRPASQLAWSAAITAGLGLIARGRLLPGVSDAGFDLWRVGPFDPADYGLLARLAAAFPASAHPGVVATRPRLAVPDPAWLIARAWDALADVLVRSPAAELVAGGPLFAAVPPQLAEHLREWSVTSSRGLDAAGVATSLRVELGGIGPFPDVEAPDQSEPLPEGELGARAVVQVSSRVDPSLVVDAEDLFDSPAAVLSRFGDQPEEELLLALRRGSRAWPPLAPLLRQRIPSSLTLTDELVTGLLSDGGEALRSAGIEVLWPSALIKGGLAVRGAVSQSPAAVAESGFKLDSIMQFQWQVTFDGKVLTDTELDQLAEAKRAVVRLRGRWVIVDRELIAKAAAQRGRHLRAAEALAVLLGGQADLDGETLPVVADGPVRAWIEKVRDVTTPGAEAVDPPGLAGALRPYQQRGVTWLDQMCELGLGGCLADDMGLGKTIQVIALHLLRRARGAGPTLVICPTSLLGNWEREARRFAPDVPVRRYHGGARHLEDLASDELVVASYGVLRRDHQELAPAGFSLLVADEAQHAKNPYSETARSLRRIPVDARVALTGTPVENRLSELWSILDWSTPGLLGPLEHFRRSVAAPIERQRDPGATERLARVVRPFLLRRRKSDPAIAPELPARTLTDHLVPLTVEQATLYGAEVKEALAEIAERQGIERRGLVLRLLTVLKQICNHPAQYLHQSAPIAARSGKLAALEELVEVIASEGESMLVFSQFVEMHTLIQRRLADLGVPSLFLHGGVPARRREELVAAFQGGEAPVFLLSLKAGGVGLNLTKATHVVHFDRWWNPAVEDQATDRAYRIGQDRPVQVHRLIAEGTLEDRIAEVLEKKRSLAESVVGEGEGWVTELSDEELADLVSLGRSEPVRAEAR